uniref:C-type lectin domain-containing protein n=1 Tax=Strigamia maritima TaxID=126957 RepID=T1JI18_STRMM
MRNKRACANDPPVPLPANPSDWNKWSRNAGKKVNYMCSKAPDAPVYKVVICSRKTLKWETLSDKPENCLCGPPIIYSSPLISNWDGKSTEVGTTITYECLTDVGRKFFQKLVCSTSVKWQVVETGSCFFVVHYLMNFTNAAEYCTQLGTEMMFIENDREHEEVIAAVSRNSDFKQKCKNRAFLGLRENVNKQWKSDNGIYISGMSEMWAVNDEGREKCVVMESPDWKLNNQLCQMASCYVCEILGPIFSKANCQDKKLCYVLGKEKDNRRIQASRCQGLNGHLARVTNIGIMDQIRAMINQDPLAKGCNGFYVGIDSDKRSFERLNGKQITYQRFTDDLSSSMSRHCTVMDEAFQYNWMDEACEHNTCFICKAIGYPLKHVVPAGLKMALSFEMREIIAAGEYDSRKRRSQPAECQTGWKLLNHHCVYFNTSNVTRDEADQFCNNSNGQLAPDLNSQLHDIIARAIFTSQDLQRLRFWHIGRPKTCSFHQCLSGCYLLNVSTGLTTESVHNCQRLAPFVCIELN